LALRVYSLLGFVELRYCNAVVIIAGLVLVPRKQTYKEYETT